MRRWLTGGLLIACCGLAANAQSLGEFRSTLRQLWHGTEALPGAAVAHWRVTVPLVLGEGLLMAYGDRPASGAIHSVGLETTSNRWSNRGLLVIEPSLIVTATSWERHCLLCVSEGEFLEREAAAELYAGAAVQALKFGAGRERPDLAGDGDGGFSEGGSSFPSGHALAAFTMASVFAHDDRSSRWTRWTAYGLSGGVTGLRFTAKEHFPSDLIAGATLGELIGRGAAPH